MPFRVVSNETIASSNSSEDNWIKIVRVKIDAKLDFGQPTTHIKIRRPDSLFRSRTYSISSPKGAAQFDITVKVYKNGIMSTYISNLKENDYIHLAKTRTKQISSPCVRVGIIVFGIGVTEVLQIESTLLSKNIETRLIVANRKVADFNPFRPHFEQVAEKYPGLFAIHYAYSREKVQGCQHGRVDANLILNVFEGWNDSHFLVVGDKNMIKSGYQLLKSCGFKKKLLR